MIIPDVHEDEGVAEEDPAAQSVVSSAGVGGPVVVGIVDPPIVLVCQQYSGSAMAPMLETIKTMITTMLSFQNGFIVS